MVYARASAVVYLLWGLLHVKAAYAVYGLGVSLDPGMVQGRLFQGAFNLLFFAVFASVIAVWLNWKNSRIGYWLNVVTVSVTDIGFILFVLVPGYLPPFPGVIGPALWVLAVVLSTLGLRRGSQSKKEPTA